MTNKQRLGDGDIIIKLNNNNVVVLKNYWSRKTKYTKIK
jgi:hypothetical protein